METSEDRHASARAYVLLALATFCWAGNQVIGRAIAGHVPPVSLSALRWVLPCLIAGFIARKHLARDWPAIKANWKVILALGATGGALFSALQYVGLQYTTAINGAVMNSLGPVFIVAAVAIMFGDPLHRNQVVGIAISLAGVLIIVTQGELARLLAFQINVGDLIIIFNMMIWGIYSGFLRLRPQMHWSSFMFFLALIGSIGALPFALVEYAQGFRFQATQTTFLTLAYVSIFPSLIAFMSWNRGVALIGASRAGAMLHLVAIYASVMAGIFLGERIAPYHILGFVLILAGVTMAARKPRA